jgi:hypothetical protein
MILIILAAIRLLSGPGDCGQSMKFMKDEFVPA